jgi:hypothetical protein
VPRQASLDPGSLCAGAIAGYRGLLLDFLVTGDRRRTRRALDVLSTALKDNYEPES